MSTHKLLRLGTEEHYEDTALYDFEYGDRVDDVRWYRSVAREHLPKGQRMIELGAGTGRITAPLARDGHEVIALDNMQAMLDGLTRRCKGHKWSRRIEAIQGDMRKLPVPDQDVALVIAPFNALMHLYTWQDLLACFKDVQRALCPGGLFAFDVQLPDLDWLLWDSDERHAVTFFRHPVTDEALVYSTNHNYDASTQVCHIHIYYDTAHSKGKRFRPDSEPKRLVHLAHRQIFPEELRMLLTTAGFEILSHSGDFEEVPLTTECDTQVLLCRKSSQR